MRVYVLSDNKNISNELKGLEIQASFRFEFLKPYSNFTIKKYLDILNKADVIIRCEYSNLPLPSTFWENFLKAWEENHFYIKCTGRHIFLDGLLIEIFGREALEHVSLERHPFLPDGSLNAFVDERAAPHWLTMEEQRFYLLDNYSRFYAKPLSVNIETTPYCDLRCTKCKFHSAQSPYTTKASKTMPGNSMMTMEEWRQIIDKINDFSRNLSISPTVRGECLMNKDLIPMVAYASRRGHNVGFYTNGNLLTKDKSKALIDAGLRSIIFSLDAVNEEQYDRLQPGGNFKTLVKNIQDLLKIRGNKKTPFIGVSFCESTENEADFETYLKLWSTQVDMVNASVELDINKGHTAWKTYYPVPYRYPCSWLWSAMYIHTNGEVATCGMDIFQEHNLGNVFEKDILSVWNGEPYMNLRKNQLGEKRNLKFCQGDISWTGSYFIEKIEGDTYQRIGPIVHERPPYGFKHQAYRIGRKVRKILTSLGVPHRIIMKLQEAYLKLT